jgi:4-amino-4-deoxy-L-arabinose transferase-like glycosyltransferase
VTAEREVGTPRSRLAPALLLALGLAASVLLVARGRGLTDPSILCYDESLYLVQGMSWTQGLLPFRDTWVNKPPLVPFVFAASYRAFGASTIPPRVLCLLALLGTSALGFALVARHESRRGAVAAAVAIATLSSTRVPPYDAVPALSEALFVLPLTLAVFLALELRSRPWLSSALAGVTLGAATLLRQNGLVFVPLVFALAALPGARLSARGTLAAAVFLAALLLSFAPAVGYFAAEGSLRELYACVWSGPRSLHVTDASRLWRPGARFLGKFFTSQPLLSGLAVAGLACSIRTIVSPGDREERLRRGALVAWFGFSAYSCLLGGRFYDHYLPMLAPAMGVLVGIGVSGLEGLLAPPRFASGRARSLVLVLASAAFLLDAGFSALDMAIRASRDAWQGNERVAEVEHGPLLARIRELTRPGDRIFFLGSCPGLYYRSERPPATPDMAGETLYFCRFLPGFKERKTPAPGGGEETFEEMLARTLRSARLVLEPKLPPPGRRWFSGQSAEQWNPDERFPQVPAIARCLEENFRPLPETVESVRLYVPK